MKISSILLLSTLMSAGFALSATTTQAQDRAQRLAQERVQPRQVVPTPRRGGPPPTASFVNRQHAMNRCERGETKHLIIAGVEDNFASSGSEPAVKSARVAAQTHTPGWNAGVGSAFDGRQVNRKIFSHLNLPANVRSGVFMIGLDPIGEILGTDGMTFGNLSDDILTSQDRSSFGYTGSSWVANVGGNLTPNGKNHSAKFRDIGLMSGGTLESYYQNSGDQILDVYVQDDHSVDYVAVSVCAGPKKKGMTWGLRTPAPESVNGVAHVGCTDKDGGKCDPYQGDTVCSTPLPILCHRPMKFQKPANLKEDRWDKWSGGIIGTTNPMPAPATLAQANSECVKEFGPGWRVAEHHDAYPGTSGWVFSAYGNVGTKGKRFWTDIKNQPNGVCWTR